MKKKQTKKPVKKSGSKAASIAGKWIRYNDRMKLEFIKVAIGNHLAKNHAPILQLIDDIDTLAASVLSQKEKN